MINYIFKFSGLFDFHFVIFQTLLPLLHCHQDIFPKPRNLNHGKPNKKKPEIQKKLRAFPKLSTANFLPIHSHNLRQKTTNHFHQILLSRHDIMNIFIRLRCFINAASEERNFIFRQFLFHHFHIQR
jgi:hypothetical protein